MERVQLCPQCSGRCVMRASGERCRMMYANTLEKCLGTRNSRITMARWERAWDWRLCPADLRLGDEIREWLAWTTEVLGVEVMTRFFYQCWVLRTWMEYTPLALYYIHDMEMMFALITCLGLSKFGFPDLVAVLLAKRSGGVHREQNIALSCLRFMQCQRFSVLALKKKPHSLLIMPFFSKPSSAPSLVLACRLDLGEKTYSTEFVKT